MEESYESKVDGLKKELERLREERKGLLKEQGIISERLFVSVHNAKKIVLELARLNEERLKG